MLHELTSAGNKSNSERPEGQLNADEFNDVFSRITAFSSACELGLTRDGAPTLPLTCEWMAKLVDLAGRRESLSAMSDGSIHMKRVSEPALYEAACIKCARFCKILHYLKAES